MTETASHVNESLGGEFVTIARVTKTQGRKGEVAAMLLTDFPERFAERKRLFLLNQRDPRREVELEDFWFHKGGVVLKFRGVDSITQAEDLAGCEVQIPLAERAELEAGSVYVSELTGCMVTDHGQEIGRIEEVQFGAGEAPLLVIRSQSRKEYLVPLAWAYIAKMSPQEKRLEMNLPEGMLELDTPLSKEEKERQKGES